jgi:hypothetical protein
MKAKLSWITLLLLLGLGTSFVLLQSCEKLKEVTTFKVKYNLHNSHFSIDSTSLLKSEMVLYTQSNSAINIDSIVGNSGLVEGVSFYKLKVSIVTPESAKINWLSSARITVAQEGGVPVEIATSPTFNATDRSIDFVCKDVDITTIIKKPFNITLYGNLNGNTPTLPMDVLLESGIEITISPL